MEKNMISFVASHGILDTHLSPYLWLPIYSSITLLFYFMNINTIHLAVYLGSIHHFSKDLDLSYLTMTISSLPLIYNKDNHISQKIILYYLSLIHTPIAYYQFFKENEITLYTLSLPLVTYVSVLKIKRFNDILLQMLQNPGKDIKRFEQRIFLSILFSHIVVHSI